MSLKNQTVDCQILNLISQAKPVATTPKYNNDIVDAKDGLEFHGVSKNKERGSKKITDHNVVDVVTFSFLLFLVLMLINHQSIKC